ncbi:hypothetical protein [Streptomyces sp. NPDC088400]|uniref:hypothetical protein n=1 Tax=Streptomyces sp. NPDC088400 TaxID=3365861 RepID=UPI0038232178
MSEHDPAAQGERQDRTYETRQMRTRITPLVDGRFRWTRQRLAGGLDTPPGQVTAGAGTSPYVLLGTRSADTVTYLVPGGRTLAEIVWPPDRFNGSSELATSALRSTGRALRDLAACPAPFPGTPAPPPALTRLTRWLDGEGTEEGAVRLHKLCRSGLGAIRMRVLRDWCRAPAGHRERQVLLHGEPSLGLIVPVPDEPHAVLLTGETLSQGPPEFDVGWLLGELAEMADVARRHALTDGQGRPPRFDAMATALMAQRGPLPDLALLRRVATLRRLAHVVDFATYVGWNPGVEAYVEALAGLVDGDGRPALTAILGDGSGSAADG